MNLVRESLYNFHKTGDIRASLGLGGLSFETLYSGAIIKPLKSFGVTEYKLKRLFRPGVGYVPQSIGGKIASNYHSAKIKIFSSAEYLVLELDRNDDGSILLKILRGFKDPEKENIRYAREELIKHPNSRLDEKFRLIGPYREWYSNVNTFFINKRQFENRFQIIEPGVKF